MVLQDAQKMFNMGNVASNIELIFFPTVNRDKISRDILNKIGPAYKEGENDSAAELLAALDMGQKIFIIFGVIAFVMGGFIIFNTFRTIVAERKRDIGILRALGASRSSIMKIIIFEGIIQGITGTGLGLLFGYIFAYVLLMLVRPIW